MNNKYIFKTLLPVLILGIAIVLYVLLRTFTPEPEEIIRPQDAPAVSTTTVNKQNVAIPIYSQGLVQPAREVLLVTEVPGKVQWVSPDFVSGRHVKEGEILLRLDEDRWNLERSKAESQLWTVQQMLARVKAELESAGTVPGLTTPSNFRNSQLKEAQLRVSAAKADLELLEAQVEKTKIRAPFDGILRSAMLDVGQVVAIGTQVGQIFQMTEIEVRVPLSDEQLQWVDLSQSLDPNNAPTAVFKMSYSGRPFLWNGRIIGLEGSLDPKNRLQYAIGVIDDANQQDAQQPLRPELVAGHFLDVKIDGRQLTNVVVLPRHLLRFGNFVWVVDSNSRLQRRDLEVSYRGKSSAYITQGLNVGDAVVDTPLEIAIEGMEVAVINESQSNESKPNTMDLKTKSPDNPEAPLNKLQKTLSNSASLSQSELSQSDKQNNFGVSSFKASNEISKNNQSSDNALAEDLSQVNFSKDKTIKETVAEEIVAKETVSQSNVKNNLVSVSSQSVDKSSKIQTVNLEAVHQPSRLNELASLFFAPKSSEP
ncbi:MAG: efflux RND transporter periplasmic adaptor subunit [Pseudomonadota bacterium]